ncbi:MAG: recombinase family protein [Bryobacteraceae bacterium]|jgi:DNA invertase Pin-like site-specific DNA recombinase
MSKTPVFAYLRVSGKGQIKGDGFPRQLAAIRKYTADHNMRIVQVFEEKGVCGATDLENRPALLAMLEALVSNGTKLVLIEKLDRLARDLMIQETIIGDLRKRGFDLISVLEPDLLQNDPTRTMMRQIFGAVAQYEKAMIVAKLRGARQRMKTRTGRCEGRKRYGDKPGESAIRDRIRSLRKGGATLRSICDTLNGEGSTTRYGRPWMLMTVQRITRR